MQVPGSHQDGERPTLRERVSLRDGRAVEIESRGGAEGCEVRALLDAGAGAPRRCVGAAHVSRLPNDPSVGEPAVAVDPDVRGLGLGRLLTERLVLAASREGIETLRFLVASENEWIRQRIKDHYARAQLTTSHSLLGMEVALPHVDQAAGALEAATHDDWSLLRWAADGSLEAGLEHLKHKVAHLFHADDDGPSDDVGR